MSRVNFERVSLRAQKSGVCPGCAKKAKRSREFWQTFNPFNRDPSGAVKTRAQIFVELRQDALKWGQEPTYHARCEAQS